MTTAENIKKVSLIFFVITGLMHLGSSIMIANEMYLKETLIVNKIMDIPFILTGLAYGFSSLRCTLTDPREKHKVLDVIFIAIIVLALIGLLALNIFFPDTKIIN